MIPESVFNRFENDLASLAIQNCCISIAERKNK